jgi:hypothetical protein
MMNDTPLLAIGFWGAADMFRMGNIYNGRRESGKNVMYFDNSNFDAIQSETKNKFDISIDVVCKILYIVYITYTHIYIKKGVLYGANDFECPYGR